MEKVLADISEKPDLQVADAGEGSFEWAEILRNAEAPDYFRVRYWYNLAANQGYAKAQNNPGTIYQRGLGGQARPCKGSFPIQASRRARGCYGSIQPCYPLLVGRKGAS